MDYGDVFIRKISKNGDSLAVNLPVEYCNAIGLARGDCVSLAIRGDGVIFIMKLSAEQLCELKPPRVNID